MAYSGGARSGAYIIGIVGLTAATSLLKAGMRTYDAISRTPEERVNIRLNEAQYYSNQSMYGDMLIALAAAERISHNHGMPVPTQRMQQLQAQTISRITGSEFFQLVEAKKYLSALLSARGNLPQHTDIDKLEILIKNEEARREHNQKFLEESREKQPWASGLWEDF